MNKVRNTGQNFSLFAWIVSTGWPSYQAACLGLAQHVLKLSPLMPSEDDKQISSNSAYWSLGRAQLIQRLDTTDNGLSQNEVERRLKEFGPNELQEERSWSPLRLLWRQLKNPLLILLIFAAAISLATGEFKSSAFVLTILFASVIIGFSREHQAGKAIAKLRARVQTKVRVIRDGQERSVPSREIVPGDVLLLCAGNLIPADGVLLSATDFFVNEAVLTGESFPVNKNTMVVESSAGLAKRPNCVFLGANVRTGAARCVVVRTGVNTEFGAIAKRLTLRPPDTEFDLGLRRFGYLLTITMFTMLLFVFVINMFLGRPPIETLLFSIALAVGLSPELLPAILSINLARGAQNMARSGVLVRRLNAIENLGSMNVLCTDKTGTLTEGMMTLEGTYDDRGGRSPKVLELAFRNASLQTGYSNPLDEAIVKSSPPPLSAVEKLGEIPYDFNRKRLSIIVKVQNEIRLITKGSFEQVLDSCTHLPDGSILDQANFDRLRKQYLQWTSDGIRVLAIASRYLPEKTSYDRADEQDLRFEGYLTFLDRIKEGAKDAISDLKSLGVTTKLISGDSLLVARHVASMVGMQVDRVLTGRNLDELNDEALWNLVGNTDLFAEVDPNQKERIILSLKKMGHVVGFLGDGINDAPAMHAADTSLSVESAVDVARDAADFVLLEKNLEVIRQGIEEGRRTFANTLKYILLTMSANLGNMISMAVASLFLPFLPLLAGQILLNNFLSDIPAIGLAGDSVDHELVDKPRRWNMRFISRFMIQFGLLSSLFDFLTFAALLAVFSATPEIFRTGWFVESLLSELVIAFIVRTRRPFYASRPSPFLFASSACLIGLAIALPFLPINTWLDFTPLPLPILTVVLGITTLYVIASEFLKVRFYKRDESSHANRPVLAEQSRTIV